MRTEIIRKTNIEVCCLLIRDQYKKTSSSFTAEPHRHKDKKSHDILILFHECYLFCIVCVFVHVFVHDNNNSFLISKILRALLIIAVI